MRGVVFTGERQLELMNFPDPTPGEGEVVIEMKASGMCGSDLHQYRRPRSRRLDRRACGAERTDHRRARALRHRRRDRAGSARGAGADRPARHGAPLQGLHRVQPLPLRLVAAVPGRAGAGLRQQRAWRPRQIPEGAGVYAGAVARRIVVHHRRGDLVRHRHRLWRVAPHPALGQRHDRDFRPGAGRPVGDAARHGDGRAGHRARCQRGAARPRQGIRRRRDRQPALERSGRRDQGFDARLRRRVHARHVDRSRKAASPRCARQRYGARPALSASATT